MELKGEYTLRAGRAAIWTALGDPGVLEACIPGCESVERLSDREMRTVVAVAFGPFKARFTGTVAVEEPQPPAKWRLRGEGRGRPAGTARGNASVELVENGGATTVSFVGSAEVGGKLGDIADSLLERQAKEMADDFFRRLESELGKSQRPWVDELDHSPAAVQLGDEPSEDVVEDKSERAGHVAEDVERRIETAAAQDFLGGPMAWGLLALIVLIVLLVLLY